jgi:excisionase family DNA binding protein
VNSTAREVDDDTTPDFLTVEEAAAVLRIGRTTAYELVREFLRTGGAEGLPARRVGRQMRVPRAALERWHGGPITWPPPRRSSRQPASSPREARTSAGPHPLRRSPRPIHEAVVEQLQLLSE